MTTYDKSAIAALVTVDDGYDREYASDRVSRYGAYLRSRAHLFADEGEPLDAVAFTVLAWQIATSPVMSPGYVRHRSDIAAVTCRHAEEPTVLVADLEVRLPWPAGLRTQAAMAGWQGWDQLRTLSDEPPCCVAPRDDRPALLITAHLWVPIAEDNLPKPRRHTAPGVADADDAKRAVRAVCRHVNTIARAVLEQMREGQR